jgi:paraquat-inducible protein B
MEMKKLITTSIFLILAGIAAVNLQGQGQGQGFGQGAAQGDGEKLTAYKIAFFTRNLNLTPAEAEKFWPLYNDFSSRRSKLQSDRILLMRYAAQNEANMSEGEIASTAEKLTQSFSDEATLVVSFNENLKKVLPPAKVIRLYQVENQYKQQLLRELNQRRQGTGQPGLRGRGQGAGTGLEQ